MLVSNKSMVLKVHSTEKDMICDLVVVVGIHGGEIWAVSDKVVPFAGGLLLGEQNYYSLLVSPAPLEICSGELGEAPEQICEAHWGGEEGEIPLHKQ